MLNDIILGLDEIDWASKAKEITSKQMEQVKKTQEQFIKAHAQGIQPDLALTDYIGKYVHPSYGLLEISDNQGNLQFALGKLQGTVKHVLLTIYR